jgi:geranylgeranyl pyrophosphate synthase
MVEGVYTLPVLHTLADGGTAATELGAILGKPLDPSERSKVLDIVRSGGGVDSAVAHARRFVVRAEHACAALPDGEPTEAMRASTAALLASVS